MAEACIGEAPPSRLIAVAEACIGEAPAKQTCAVHAGLCDGEGICGKHRSSAVKTQSNQPATNSHGMDASDPTYMGESVQWRRGVGV